MGILPSIRFCCPGGLGSGERETNENNRRDRRISPHTTPTLREETNGVTPRTDHTSRTNTTATRRRGGTRGGREATATKNKSGTDAQREAAPKQNIKKRISPPQFFHWFVNFFFLSAFSALCTKGMNSLPPLEKIFISSYIYTIQTERESLPKDETQRELCSRGREDAAGRSPCISHAPSPGDLKKDSVGSECSRDQQQTAIGFSFSGRLKGREKERRAPFAGLVLSFTEGRLPHVFLH